MGQKIIHSNGDMEEMDFDNMQRCQSLTDAMDSVNNRDRWWNLSKLHCTSRKKTGDISLIGVGYKNKVKRRKNDLATSCVRSAF